MDHLYFYYTVIAWIGGFKQFLAVYCLLKRVTN